MFRLINYFSPLKKAEKENSTEVILMKMNVLIEIAEDIKVTVISSPQEMPDDEDALKLVLMYNKFEMMN